MKQNSWKYKKKILKSDIKVINRHFEIVLLKKLMHDISWHSIIIFGI